MAQPLDTTYTAIEVRPLSVHIGAEIRGVDLTRPLPPEQVQEIRAALLQWKVVFFREQFLDHAQHIAFARHFGALTPGHVVFGHDGDYPEIYAVAKYRTANSYREQVAIRPWTGWHTDITAAINPPAASILRGDVVPPYGGDTQWTNLVAAYQALSPAMQRFVDGLRGIHRFAPPPEAQPSPEYEALVRRHTLISEHPLVRVHPETGERVLFVSPSFLKAIVGLTPRESQCLLEFLWEHAVRPEFTIRFKWEPGSVAFWDNRSTAHLAPRDIFAVDFDRQFYRVTLHGDVPVGVDGTPSRALAGEPIPAITPAW
ncbi:MAG: taurine dioxygenase [Candidatus Tectimicrobiota bacterium]|nr:MAG: taurine dioxygenase [Candidatus Tectomicrobia bacterium]